MDQKLAVLFMPDDMTLTKEKTPLMLRPILFCPILTWMVEELMGQGVERFFIVSDARPRLFMTTATSSCVPCAIGLTKVMTKF